MDKAYWGTKKKLQSLKKKVCKSTNPKFSLRILRASILSGDMILTPRICAPLLKDSFALSNEYSS